MAKGPEAGGHNKREGRGRHEVGGGGRPEMKPVHVEQSEEDHRRAEAVAERARATTGGGAAAAAPAAPASPAGAPAAHPVGHGGGGGFLGFLGKVWGVLAFMGHAALAAGRYIGKNSGAKDSGHAAPKAASGGGGHGHH